jgi:hypothetical protein
VRRALLFAAASFALPACAFPQSQVPVLDGTVLQSTRDPMQYRAPLPRDVKPTANRAAHGEACRTAVYFPPVPPPVFYGSSALVNEIPYRNLQLLVGDGGYARAMAVASDSVDGAPIFDVRADLHTQSFLGIVRRECLEVHAWAATRR